MTNKPKSAKRGSYKARWAREAEEFKVEYEQNIRNFEAAVLDSFSFLEAEYGFQRSALERRDFDHFRDANVVVPYFGEKVAVQVGYGICNISVGASICELENGRMPEPGDPGYGRAINVEAYVLMVSGGTVPPVLPQPSQRKPRIGYDRAAEMCSELLRTNMAGVIAQLAERTTVWCAPILKGDTSMFPAAQQFYKKYLRDRYH